MLPVGDKIFIRPFLLIGLDLWQFVGLELLILWRMRIVESLLLQRDISADKKKKLAVLPVKFFVRINKTLYNVHERCLLWVI